ncbi:MAG: adenylate/guanylate cyclase domain-containing protein [Candidatus Ozemobacteraceae bacterium]
MDNRLATIVFVDMQGYTKRSAQQTIDEMKLFHDEMFGFVKQLVEKYAGILVKTLGDGFLVRFDSPTNAVQCGLEMQRKLESRNANILNPDSIVRFRIGINTGEVGIDETGDLFGDPVNIASRIQSYAEPNEVYISESTYLAMNRNEFGTQDLGPQSFKNATREIRIYKILKRGSPGVTLPRPVSAANAVDTASQQVPSHTTSSKKPYLFGALAGAMSISILFFAWKLLLRPRGSPKPPAPPAIAEPAAPAPPKPRASTPPAAQLPAPAPFIPGKNSGENPQHRPEFLKVPPHVQSSQRQPELPYVRSQDHSPRPPQPREGPENPPEGMDDEAMDATLDPLAIDPANPPKNLKLNPRQQSLLNQVRTMRNSGDKAGALRTVEFFLQAARRKNFPVKPQFQILEAQLLIENGRRSEAEALLNNVLATVPQNARNRPKIEKRVTELLSGKSKP